MTFSSIGKQGTRWVSRGHREFYGQARESIPKFGALVNVNPPKR